MVRNNLDLSVNFSHLNEVFYYGIHNLKTFPLDICISGYTGLMCKECCDARNIYVGSNTSSNGIILNPDCMEIITSNEKSELKFSRY